MKWHQLTKGQQDTARRIVEQLWDAGIKSATTSSVARHLDDAMHWQGGTISTQGLCDRTGWAAPAPPVQEITARELAACLGVSITTAYRRCRAGAIQAAKNTAGRWVITVPAAA